MSIFKQYLINEQAVELIFPNKITKPYYEYFCKLLNYLEDEKYSKGYSPDGSYKDYFQFSFIGIDTKQWYELINKFTDLLKKNNKIINEEKFKNSFDNFLRTQEKVNPGESEEEGFNGNFYQDDSRAIESILIRDSELDKINSNLQIVNNFLKWINKETK